MVDEMDLVRSIENELEVIGVVARRHLFACPGTTTVLTARPVLKLTFEFAYFVLASCRRTWRRRTRTATIAARARGVIWTTHSAAKMAVISTRRCYACIFVVARRSFGVRRARGTGTIAELSTFGTGGRHARPVLALKCVRSAWAPDALAVAIAVPFVAI